MKKDRNTPGRKRSHSSLEDSSTSPTRRGTSKKDTSPSRLPTSNRRIYDQGSTSNYETSSTSLPSDYRTKNKQERVIVQDDSKSPADTGTLPSEGSADVVTENVVLMNEGITVIDSVEEPEPPLDLGNLDTLVALGFEGLIEDCREQVNSANNQDDWEIEKERIPCFSS